MKVNYVFWDVNPNTYGILAKNSTPDSPEIYTHCSDEEWANRMKSYGEIVLHGRVVVKYHIGRQSFECLDEAMSRMKEILEQTPEGDYSVGIEVDTTFFVFSGSDTEFTSIEQARR